MKLWTMLMMVVLADASGNMLLSHGMKRISSIRQAVRDPILGSGVLCMALSFSLFLALLSWADLSFVLPVTALGYGVNALGARYLLKENVTAKRWAGTAFICLGVGLVSLSTVWK